MLTMNCFGTPIQAYNEHYPREQKEYQDRLNDSRSVWLNGVRVGNVADHPMTSGAVSAIATYYSEISKYPDIHCATDRDGRVCARSLCPPSTKDELYSLRASYTAIAELSHGMLGRTPDFMNAAVMAIGSHSDALGQGLRADFAANAENYHSYCRAWQPFIAHAAINPQIDRTSSLSRAESAFAGVKVLNENADGITVSGAKMIGTLASIADEVLVFNMPGLSGEDADFAVAFATPSGTPGLSMVSRKVLTHPDAAPSDYPLSHKADEVDSLLIFDEVFVPWERVLVYKDVAASNRFYDQTFCRNHTGLQGVARGLVKAEVVAGTALRLAEVIGAIPQSRSALGEIASGLEVLRALVDRAVDTAELASSGVMTPGMAPIQAFRLTFPRQYASTLEFMRSLAPGSLLSSPQMRDLSGPLGDLLTTGLSTNSVSAANRSVILALAWDLLGEGFGQRQLTYEYYHAGAPEIIARGQFDRYDWGSERAAIARITDPLLAAH